MLTEPDAQNNVKYLPVYLQRYKDVRLNDASKTAIVVRNVI